MPHGESWFNLLPFFHSVEEAAAGLPGPASAEGKTWIAHETIHVQHVFGLALVLLLLLVIGLIARAGLSNTKAALVPEDKLTARTFVELFVSAAYRMMADIMGPKAAKFFLPLIGTCAFVILLSNLLGLVPGFTPPTDSLNTTVAMSLVIFFATHLFGLKENGFGYIKHFFGPVIFLAPLFFIIEIISNLARPLSLSIRLMANMFADHQVLSQVSGLVAWVVPVAPMMLGTMVCVVQTLVFCILSTVYISMAIAHHEHDDHEAAAHH
ncbi:MAG TPA: F0F1 ATP synthase subunit A [Polyangiales bacterium]